MQFWDAYYLEKIQEMKAQRKADMEGAVKPPSGHCQDTNGVTFTTGLQWHCWL